jgi:hypothetical protein
MSGWKNVTTIIKVTKNKIKIISCAIMGSGILAENSIGQIYAGSSGGAKDKGGL